MKFSETVKSLITFVSFASLALGISASSQARDLEIPQSPEALVIKSNKDTTFLFIHGAWHGGWAWDLVTPLLEDRGYNTVAIDLPGAGEDQTIVPLVTLKSYAIKICKTARKIGIDQKIILVGHSMGGIAISEATEYCPEHIDRLVFLAAFVPINGFSLIDLDGLHLNLGQAPTVPGAFELAFDFGPPVLRLNDLNDADNLNYIYNLFYGDMDIDSPEVQLALRSINIDQAAVPLGTPSSVGENFVNTPKTCIKTKLDGAISPEVQDLMYQIASCNQLEAIKSSHSPFLSQAETVVNRLIQADNL